MADVNISVRGHRLKRDWSIREKSEHCLCAAVHEHQCGGNVCPSNEADTVKVNLGVHREFLGSTSSPHEYRSEYNTVTSIVHKWLCQKASLLHLVSKLPKRALPDESKASHCCYGTYWSDHLLLSSCVSRISRNLQHRLFISVAFLAAALSPSAVSPICCIYACCELVYEIYGGL